MPEMAADHTTVVAFPNLPFPSGSAGQYLRFHPAASSHEFQAKGKAGPLYWQFGERIFNEARLLFFDRDVLALSFSLLQSRSATICTLRSCDLIHERAFNSHHGYLRPQPYDRLDVDC